MCLLVLISSHLLLQGKSSKFAPHAQKVSLSHLVQDEDVVSSMSITLSYRYSPSYHISSFYEVTEYYKYRAVLICLKDMYRGDSMCLPRLT